MTTDVGGAAAAPAAAGTARGRLADVRLRRRARTASRRSTLSPPFRPRLDVQGAAACRVPAGDRVRAALLREQLRRRCSPSTRRPASAPGSYRIGPLRRRLAGRRRPAPSTRSFLNRPPCNARRKPERLDGEVIAFAAGFGKIRWRTRIGPTESLAARRRRRRLRRRLARPRLRARRDDRQGALDVPGRAAIKGARRPSGNRLYVGSYDGHLYCAAGEDGQADLAGVRRRTRLGGRGHFYSTPAIAYGRVYIGSTDGKVYSVRRREREAPLVARHRRLRLRARRRSGDRLVLVGSYSGRFYALDAATGDVRWRFQANGDISGSATVIDGVVYFATLQGRTYALDARTGKRSGRSRTASTRRRRRRPRPALPRRPRAGLWDGREVRYVVTGAAGLHRLAPRRGARWRAGHDVARRRLLHRLLRPGAEGGERARRSTCVAARPRRRRRSTDLAGVDGVFHLAGQPGVRGAWASASSSTSPQRARDPARVRGGRGRGRARRLRLVLVGLRRRRALPDARGRRRRGRSRRTGSRSSRASTSPARTRARVGLDAVVLRYFTVYGPRQRPDMAFTPRRRRARRRRPFQLFGDGSAVAQLHVRRRRGRRRRSPRWSAAARGDDLQRRRRRGGDDARGDRAARASRRDAASTSRDVERGRRATCSARRPT